MRPDRFRFFHQGLGKRTVPIETAENVVRGGMYQTDKHLLQTMQKLVEKIAAENTNPNSYYIKGQVSANPFLERTSTYKILRDLNNLYGNKRAPEVFSENLYPIQAGKQQLEVTLDRSLNDKQLDNFDYDIGDGESSDVDEYDADNQNDIPTESVESGITKTPYDLTFGSPDPGESDQYQIYANESDDDANVSETDGVMEDKDSSYINDQRTKRWWAAEKFRRFRSAKSWKQYGSRGKHIDPALYFIGLGK